MGAATSAPAPAPPCGSHDSGDYNVAEIAALFSISRPTVCRSLDRTTDLPPLPADTRAAPDIAQDDQLLTSASATEARES